jgi:hypothetical protein
MVDITSIIYKIYFGNRIITCSQIRLSFIAGKQSTHTCIATFSIHTNMRLTWPYLIKYLEMQHLMGQK